jgi:hypothetical protein
MRGPPAGEVLELWQAAAKAGMPASAPAATVLAHAGEAEPSPANRFSEEEIERAKHVIEASDPEAARAWPPRRNVCPTN